MSIRPSDVEAIFCDAIDMADDVRREHLDVACGGDATLRRRVEELLRAHDGAGRFLAGPADASSSHRRESGTPAPGPSCRLGDVIGHYRLLQVLGEGGFGAVYLAEQQAPIRRQVALKIIRAGMDSRQVMARFEAERQALALMDHPHIARVFDAGATPDGRPYFVMEAVDGVPITRFVDEQGLDLRARLELFITVCHAVQHAHQKGVIHRDLKPGNVLVSAGDDGPHARVIDFGVAKATTPAPNGGGLTEDRQLIGTPQYMSPEQAEGGFDIDTRSDVYSLGALLYELLSGRTPLDGRRLGDATMAEMQRIIREEEPPRPSARRGRGEASHAAAALRGDLDCIVMKCLEKDRRRRYDTASDLALDLRRYLDGDPVAARPAGALYRARKFTGRHRTATLAAAVVVLAMLGGIVGASRGLVRARRAEAVAARERDLAERERLRADKQAAELRDRAYSQHIALAQGAIQDHDIAACRRSLNDSPPEQRGWEWRHLNWLADRSLATRRGHPWQVWRVAISPDGRRVVSAGDEFTLRVWSLPGGEAAATVPLPNVWVRGMAFSPDGASLVLGDYEGNLRVLDAGTFDTLRVVKAHPQRIWQLNFSADGRRLVSTGWDATARVWDWPDLTPRYAVAHADAVLDAAFSRDGRWLATAGADSVVQVWDAATGARRWRLTGRMWRANCVRFSPDGRRLYSGHDDKIIKVWDLDTGAETTTLYGHQTGVLSMAISSDGRRLITGSWDRTIRIWRLGDDDHGGPSAAGAGQRPAGDITAMTLTGHEDPIWSVSLSADGRHIVSGSADGTVRIWDADTGPESPVFVGHQWGIAKLAFSPDGSRLASGGTDRLLRIRDAGHGEDIATAAGHAAPINDVQYAPDGGRIATASDDGTIRLWRPDGRPLATLGGHDGPVRGLAFRRDGRHLASAADRTVHVWDVTSGEVVWTVTGPDGEFGAVLFHTTRPELIGGAADGTIRVWDESTGREVRTFEADDRAVRCLAISPDGRTLAAGFLVDHTIRLWDYESGHVRGVLLGHENPVSSLSFSPDGRRLLSSGHDRTVRLWDPRKGREVISLLGHEDDVWSAAFSPDGATIASAGADWSIRLWETGPPPCSHAERATAAWASVLVQELSWKTPVLYEIRRLIAERLDLPVDVRAAAERIARARFDRRWNETIAEQTGLLRRDPESADALHALEEALLSAARHEGSWSPLPTWRSSAPTWRYTAERPAADWTSADFDDSGWSQGVAPFGTTGAASEWRTPEIWARLGFDLGGARPADVLALLRCDDGAEVHLNGIPAIQRPVWTPESCLMYCSAESVAALRTGPNVVAVHVSNIGGDAWLDLELGVSAGEPSRRLRGILDGLLAVHPDSALLRARRAGLPDPSPGASEPGRAGSGVRSAD